MKPRHCEAPARRVAAIGGITGLALAISAGTATAGGDEECTGIAVCAEDVVKAGDVDVDVNILTHSEDSGYPPVHLGP